MASDRPGGDWRQPTGGQRPTPARGTRPATSRRSWQPGGTDQPASPRKRSRGLRLAVGGGVAVGLIGLIAWLVVWLWPVRYPNLASASAPAGERLVLFGDAAGANAAAALAGWAAEGGTSGRPRPDPTPAVTAAAGGPKIHIDPAPKNLLVYITASGGADAKGAFVWVAPANARSAADAQKAYIRDVLDRVAEARRDKPTLLVFDSTRVPVSWAHGMVFNDFARALKELDAEIAKNPNLVVICSSDDDQRSWVFEERGVSAFAYFFQEALRGAGRKPGERVTAATAFGHARAEVERWAIGNRAEKQVPILLPTAGGAERAGKIALAAAPASGYQSPAAEKVDPPAQVPTELKAAWATAAEIARQSPPPEADTPALWREYLETLLRWEHLFRLGADTAAVQAAAGQVAGQLRNPPAATELPGFPTAVPAARALGRPPALPDPAAAGQFRSDFHRIWRALPAERKANWEALLRNHPGRENAIRIAAADLVLVFLIDDGPDPDNLALAEEILDKVVFPPGEMIPAEAHFVRMLHHRLDKPGRRPDPALLKRALALRREAEEVAWVCGARPGEHPYAEFVFGWVRVDVENADRRRHLGQDLLFAADPESFKEAADHFDAAEREYARAKADGRKVVEALATRDRVLARLPYYARWLAGYRGPRPPARVVELLEHAEKAAVAAHQISGITDNPTPARRDAQLADLEASRAAAEGHFRAVVEAFEEDVRKLNNNAPLPSNWHALDAALAVPFVPDAQLRGELLGHLRHISHQLAVKTQQPTGSEVSPPRVREATVWHTRLARAVLGEAATDRPDPSGWWVAYRAAGDEVGDRFRSLATKARATGSDAAIKPSLAETAPLLARAALLARLADPAAPMPPKFDPVAIDQRFRRHELLLWQAKRTTTEGWAGVAPTTRDGWYCRKAADKLVDSAKQLIRQDALELKGPVDNMPPADKARWLSGCEAEAARLPVSLSFNTDKPWEVVDDGKQSWDFDYTVSAAEKDRAEVGFPVWWLKAGGEVYPRPEPESLARRAVRDFAAGQLKVTRPVRLLAGTPPARPATEVTPTVLYRGHLYGKPTELTLVGTPTREVVYTPPQGGGAFAIRAQPGAVTGAVTILIDMTDSMNHPKEAPRLPEARKGLKQILRDMPPGTLVTLAKFYGNADRSLPTVLPVGRPTRMDGENWEQLYKGIENEKALGESTPIAGAIRDVLSKTPPHKFWPDEYTGTRTLVVLTDGADNWGIWPTGTSRYPGGKEPGEVAFDALKATEDDVSLHVIFFGLSREEEKRATEQFQRIENLGNFNDPQRPRTPAQLHPEVRDGDGLAREVRKALLPKFMYRHDDKLAGVLEASIPQQERGLKPTRPLDRGVYDFARLKAPQAIELWPGERVLLQARREKAGGFELVRPEYGYEVARDRRYPVGSSGTAETGGLRGGLAALGRTPRGNAHRLDMVMTLEPIAQKEAPPILAAPRPKFAWCEVDYPDGHPGYKQLTRCVRVENRVENPAAGRKPVWAPAWDVTVTNWAPVTIEEKNLPAPVVTGYWLSAKSLPADKQSIAVNMADVPGSAAEAQKPRRVGTAVVTQVRITVEQYSAPGLPEGEYLTVRLDYGKPGDLVFVRPVNLKGTEHPFRLHERHTYYDGKTKYTARFGPILESDRATVVSLDLYSVADLKVEATKSKGVVTLRPTPGQLTNGLTIPTELVMEPTK